MTDRYAVVGHPVAHSKSPAIHAAFARETRQDIRYDRLLAPLDGFKTTVNAFRDAGGRGLNVTLPFKQQAWQLAEHHGGSALTAAAVNTLDFRDGLCTGHNTDGVGLVTDIRDNLHCPFAARRVLMLGAGGATYGVMESILRERPLEVVIANRTLAKASALVAHFTGIASLAALGVRFVAYDELAGMQFDVVVNATSAGLDGGMPPLPRGVFAAGALAYDMLYGRQTAFMQFAAAEGAAVSDGCGMLVEQAAASFEIWRGVRPSTAPVIDALRAGREPA